jgi:cob(I)alamin adenosyltransferase
VKIYTRTGDRGETGLYGGLRVSKASERVGAYGALDELNASLGVARSRGLAQALDDLVAEVQEDLFVLGAELATVPGKEDSLGMRLVDEASIARLEQHIDASEAALPPLKSFILPGGVAGAAELHLARTVCRRAERLVVALRREEPVRDQVVVYLNRLSDLLFSLARGANHRAGVADVPWTPRPRG